MNYFMTDWCIYCRRSRWLLRQL